MANDAKDTKKRNSGGKDHGAKDAAARLQKQAKDFQEMMEGGLDADALKKVAGKHADPKLMKQLEKLQSGGEMDMKGAADLAAQLGDSAGMNGDTQELLKALGGLGDEVDVEAAGKIPGLVVDKEAGTISVLGLIDLDAKDPMARTIANGLMVGYNYLLLPINARLYDTTQRGVSQFASGFDLTKASNQRIGTAAALGVAGLTSFWPAINGFMQMEKQNRKAVMQTANRFAPLLDTYDNSRASRVSKLYRIRPEQNEMITNERRRMMSKHRAERLKQATQAVGQAPFYAVSVMDGQAKLAEGAEKLGSTLAAKTEEAEATFWKELGDKAKFIEEQSGGRIKGDKALEMAKERLEGGPAKAAGSKGKSDSILGDLGDEVRKGLVTVAAPLAANMVSQTLFNKRLKDNQYQSVSASDMVFHLRNQLDEDPKADRFALPDGLSIEGSKAGKNEIRLEEYVEQIFRQHERDSRGENAKISARYDERMTLICGMIADALRDGRLDGLAMVRLAGERQIIRDGGRFVADEEIVGQEIERLEQEMRHLEYVDREKYFAEASFTPAELKDAWNGMDGEEREAFSLMVPPQVLESVGVSATEIGQMRERHQDHFYEDLATISENLLAMDEKDLKSSGLTRQETSLLKELSKTAEKDGAEKLGGAMGKQQLSQVSQAIANMIVSGGQHQGTISSLAQQRAT